MAYRVKDRHFRAFAALALETLPEEFKKRMENVSVSVEDYPSPEDARSVGVPREELLGLFHGVSYPERGGFFGMPNPLPERIALYKKNIEAVCSTKEELIEEIRKTLLHEIGHYFGLSEEDLEKYE